MLLAIVGIAKMLPEPAFGKHLVRITANRDWFTGFEHMMLVQHQPVRVILHRAAVFNCLPVVFAGRLKAS